MRLQAIRRRVRQGLNVEPLHPEPTLDVALECGLNVQKPGVTRRGEHPHLRLRRDLRRDRGRGLLRGLPHIRLWARRKPQIERWRVGNTHPIEAAVTQTSVIAVDGSIGARPQFRVRQQRLVRGSQRGDQPARRIQAQERRMALMIAAPNRERMK